MMIACRAYCCRIIFLVLTICFLHNANAQKDAPVQVSSAKSAGAFTLAAGAKAADIFIDAGEAAVVHIAAAALQKDIKAVTGIAPAIHQTTSLSSTPVIIATIGQSALATQLMKKDQLQLSSIRDKWETFTIAMVNNPLPGVQQALCIIGSDSRGTAFGVFELSRMIGVSPWYWWADVEPGHKNALYVSSGKSITGPPSVKYRGIFLNDEDWGLQPWAAKHMDTTIKDIGPNTYAHIFELLLRLKANYIWPAMHSCTKAFYYYPQNGKTAADYAIIVGTSHCEPMMRNNLFEWSINYKNEYHTEAKEWRYDVNKQQIYPYWEDRIKQVKDYPTVVTVGMRGIHDGSMPGPKDINGKVKLLQQVITDQRAILTNTLRKKETEIPQIFCPYKEVLDVYRAGLQLPDDITIVWADDNFGYIRQLSNAAEQQRAGRSGVYYHLSYWGRPQDYLWLSTQSPALISYEMSKAYTYGADRLWVFNVGDLKPAEMEMAFSMDLAWDVRKWQPLNAYGYAAYWAGEVFGKEFATEIAAIKNEYYRLAAAGKPEHLGKVLYTNEEADERIKSYQRITQMAEALQPKIPARLRDAYFQLVLYPVKAAALMNEKILFARKSIDLAQKGDPLALDYSRKAEASFAAIEDLTFIYNKQTAKGKWDGIMNWHPRDLEVFRMPPFANAEMVTHFRDNPADAKETVFEKNESAISIPAITWTTKKDAPNAQLQAITGIGIGGFGMALLPFDAAPVAQNDLSNAAYAEYKIGLDTGNYTLRVKCLPTHDINKDLPIQYAVSVNGAASQWIKVDAPAETKLWDVNVVYGFIKGEIPFTVSKGGDNMIRIYLPAPGVVVNQLEIVKTSGR